MEGYDRATIEQQYTGRFAQGQRAEIRHEGAKVRGAPMAPVTIVEFSDFQCPYCGAAHPELTRLLREFDGQVKLVFKYFPLSGHDRAMPAARAAEAAARQGKFWEMHDMLFEHQHELEDADFERYANALGLDMESSRRTSSRARCRRASTPTAPRATSSSSRARPRMYVEGGCCANHSRLCRLISKRSSSCRPALGTRAFAGA